MSIYNARRLSMGAVATLLPMDNWRRIYRMTNQTVTKDIHRGEILGATIERRWITIAELCETFDYPVVNEIKAFEVIHPEFKITIEASALRDMSRWNRPGENPQVPVMLEGDFDAYDSFQVLLKMLGDDDLSEDEDDA